jgi:hypothetical protein
LRECCCEELFLEMDGLGLQESRIPASRLRIGKNRM